MSLGEQKSHTGGVEDTLLHWESLLVVSSGNLEDVTLELVTDTVTWNLVSHSLVHEDSDLSVVVDIDQFVGPIGRVRDVH